MERRTTRTKATDPATKVHPTMDPPTMTMTTLMARRRGRMKPYSSSNEGDNSYGSGNNNKTYGSRTSGDKYDSFNAGNYGSSDTSGNYPSSTTATKAGYNLVRFVSRFACTN